MVTDRVWPLPTVITVCGGENVATVVADVPVTGVDEATSKAAGVWYGTDGLLLLKIQLLQVNELVVVGEKRIFGVGDAMFDPPPKAILFPTKTELPVMSSS